MKKSVLLVFTAGCMIIMWACAKTEEMPETAEEMETLSVWEEETDEEDSEMIFSEPLIESRTREILDKTEGRIMKSELLQITEFCMDNSESDLISPFRDLQWYVNLEKIRLWDCGVVSLDGVEKLTGLRELNVRNNQITNIEPVKNLTNLVSFSCAGNLVKDYSALSGLINLEELQIGDDGSADTDISFLVNLTKLQSLYAPWCGISDVSALRNLTGMEYLNLFHNRVSDVSALEGLEQLDYLELGLNEIEDIAPLYGLTKLTYINLGGNEISEETLNAFFEEKKGQEFSVRQSGRLQEDMPEFIFELTAYFDLKMRGYSVESLKVYEEDTLLQTISIPELSLFGQTFIWEDSRDTLGFELEDLNFDGYQDIRLFDTLNGNYRTEWIYLVWNLDRQIFENDKRLNAISLATFDQEKKLIYGMERGGADMHYFSTYQYIEDEIVKIRYEEEEGLWRNDEQIARYYEMAEVETDATAFSAFHHLIMERKEETGELETVLDEYVFYPSDSEGEEADEEELHVDVNSELGRFINEDEPN